MAVPCFGAGFSGHRTTKSSVRMVLRFPGSSSGSDSAFFTAGPLPLMKAPAISQHPLSP